MAPTRHWQTLLLGATAVAVLAGLDQSGVTRQGSDAQPVGSWEVSASETTHYASLEGLVTGSTAVVDATVTDVQPGRTITGDLDESFTFTLVTIEIAEPLAGEDIGRTVTLEEDGVLAPIPEVGDRSIYFLWRKRDGDGMYFRIVNSQGRYQVVGSMLVPVNPVDALAKDLAALGLADLTHQIRDIGEAGTAQ
jgi:hypothetical protein